MQCDTYVLELAVAVGALVERDDLLHVRAGELVAVVVARLELVVLRLGADAVAGRSHESWPNESTSAPSVLYETR